MTADEIKKSPLHCCDSECGTARWLKEIAYQLAVMNETRLKEPINVCDVGRFDGDPR